MYKKTFFLIRYSFRDSACSLCESIGPVGMEHFDDVGFSSNSSSSSSSSSKSSDRSLFSFDDSDDNETAGASFLAGRPRGRLATEAFFTGAERYRGVNMANHQRVALTFGGMVSWVEAV